MIVCATPRSGGTKFGYDKAQELGIPFLNEVVPGNAIPFQFRPTWKNKFHELPCQPILTMDQLHRVTAYPESNHFVILVNGTNSHWLFHKADWFVARKNIKDWLCSVCNFWIKNRQGKMGLELIQTYLTFTIENGFTLYDFCRQHDKNIHWYEDMVYARKTSYTSLVEHKDYKKIIETMDYLVKSSNLLDTHEEIFYDRGFEEK